jgi:uncharacterized alkaline shock family protein YloU
MDTSAIPPAERGRTTIAPRVVRRLAEAAAREPGRVSRTTVTAVRARADVDRTSAAVRLVVKVGYPAPVRSLAADVRDHVTGQLHKLTDLTVRRVDVTVVPATPPRTRRVE